MTAPISATAAAPMGISRNSECDRQAGCDRAPDQPGGDEGTHGIETAMRHIDDAHHPEDEAQSGSDQEEDRSIEQ